jgi:polyhydroxyalkanoate synthase
MASPFSMPDKFVQGFFKSGQSLLQAFAGTGGASVGIAAPAS